MKIREEDILASLRYPKILNYYLGKEYPSDSSKHTRRALL